MSTARYLRAGVGRTVITPPAGIAHAGWGAQLHERAAGVDLDLWATALVLADDDGQQAAIVDLDLCILNFEQAAAIRAAVAATTGIPPASIRLSCTHTHSGPVTDPLIGSWIRGGSELVPGYAAALPALVAGAVWEAQQRLQPARVAVGQGACAINVNRRYTLPDGRVVTGNNPDGPVDHTVTVVRLDDLAERPIATLLHYSCHPTIMGPDNQLITPDYPGVAKRVVESTFGGRCLFLQGATGNVGPVEGFVGDLAVYRRLGTILGLEAARVAWTTSTYPRRARPVAVQESGTSILLYEYEPVGEPDPTLRVATRTVDLPLRPQPTPGPLAEEAAAAEEALHRARAEGAPPEAIRQATMRAKRTAMYAHQAALMGGRASFPLELQGIRLGPVGLVATSVEPFVGFALAVRRRSPLPVGLLSGYSNGYAYYLPTADEYERGGYEISISPYTPAAAALFEEAAVAVLEDLAAA